MKNWIIVILSLMLLFKGLQAKGQWEIGFHYSSWSINIIEPILRDEITEIDEYEVLELDLSSNGNNYGFEVRYFPKGKDGSFSLGFSYERNNFKMKLTGTARHEVEQKTGELKGNLNLLPHSVNLSVRWDLWQRSRVHPYIGIGIGVGGLWGKLNYTVWENGEITEQEVEKNIDEWVEEQEAEGEGPGISFVPIIHIHIGARGEVVENLYLLGEIAFYDGLIFRGGIAYRF